MYSFIMAKFWGCQPLHTYRSIFTSIGRKLFLTPTTFYKWTNILIRISNVLHYVFYVQKTDERSLIFGEIY